MAAGIDDAVLAAIIEGGALVAGTGTNITAQNTNKRYLYRLGLHNQQLQQNAAGFLQGKVYEKYFSPAARMRQYSEAGLNPNLIYGSANNSAQFSGPAQNQVEYEPTDYSAITSAAEALAKTPLVIQQLKAAKLGNRQAELENENIGLRNERAAIENNILSEKKTQEGFNTFIKMMEYNTLSEMFGYDSNGNKNDETHSRYITAKWAELERAKVQSETDEERQSVMRAQADLYKVDMALKETKKNLVDIELKYKGGVGLEPGQKGYYELENELIELKKQLAGIDVDWAEIEKELGAATGIGKVLTLIIRKII